MVWQAINGLGYPFLFFNETSHKCQEKPVGHRVLRLGLGVPYLTLSFSHSVLTENRNLHFGQSIDYAGHHSGDMSYEMLLNLTKIQPKWIKGQNSVGYIDAQNTKGFAIGWNAEVLASDRNFKILKM